MSRADTKKPTSLLVVLKNKENERIDYFGLHIGKYKEIEGTATCILHRKLPIEYIQIFIFEKIVIGAML
jgi:hypothetical protein